MGDVVLRSEGAIAITVDDAELRSILDVGGCPIGRLYIGELSYSTCSGYLESEAADHHSSKLCSGDGVARLEGAVCVPADDLEIGKNCCSFVILGVLSVGEGLCECEAYASEDHCEYKYK